MVGTPQTDLQEVEVYLGITDNRKTFDPADGLEDPRVAGNEQPEFSTVVHFAKVQRFRFFRRGKLAAVGGHDGRLGIGEAEIGGEPLCESDVSNGLLGKGACKAGEVRGQGRVLPKSDPLEPIIRSCPLVEEGCDASEFPVSAAAFDPAFPCRMIQQARDKPLAQSGDFGKVLLSPDAVWVTEQGASKAGALRREESDIRLRKAVPDGWIGDVAVNQDARGFDPHPTIEVQTAHAAFTAFSNEGLREAYSDEEWALLPDGVCCNLFQSGSRWVEFALRNEGDRTALNLGSDAEA